MMNFSSTPGGGVKGRQLMSFQNYVRSLTNDVDENTACKKYRDFRENLSQSKVGRFFDANKDREWFRFKYHPTESQLYSKQQNLNFRRRLKIFNDLNDKKIFESLSYTKDNHSFILNLMDAIIIQLEDGPQELVDQLLSQDDTKIDHQLKENYIPLKPNSLVIDDISIETTLAEIQDFCIQANPDLLRIAQLDPHYVGGGHLRRKVIVVYKTCVDIKDVCWKLSRMKLNNRPLNVYINKCLTNRIHSIDVISNHHISIINDIRNAIILVLNFDELRGLFGKRKQFLENSLKESSDLNNSVVKMEVSHQDSSTEQIDTVAPLSPPGSEKSVNEEDGEKPFDVNTLDEDVEKEKKKIFEFRFNTDLSLHKIFKKLNKYKNPVLDGALDYLVDYIESSAAQYQLSKVPKHLQAEPQSIDLDKIQSDRFSTIKLLVENLSCTLEQSTKFLDKMLWYLRIVHSFDYYKKTIYRQEDELTLRMGVIHLRDDPSGLPSDVDAEQIKKYLHRCQKEFEEFGQAQIQKFVTKDEERFSYKSYGKVITDELASYTQKIQKQKSNETEEVYKCKHCTRVFQKLTDIGRHFVSKHRWAIDAIELETDFFNAYLFDSNKINPCVPKELIDVPPNRYAKITNFSQMDEDPDLLQQTIEAYNKMDSFVREPAPREQVESDPRNESIVDYTDISFDDAI